VGIGDLDGDADPDILVRAGTNSGKEGLWWYETIIYDAGVQRRWLSATVSFSSSFSSCAISGVLVKLYVRASKDLISWTPWIFVGDYTSSASLPLPSPFDVINYRYLQYRLELYSSTDSTKTPIVDFVRFDYDPLGSDEDLVISENGSLNVKAEGKEILVYTIDGRLILRARGELNAPLRRGVYKVLIGKNSRTVIIR